MNGLTLADDRIRFASTLMFYGVVMQQLIVISVITTGIAYSWMKMCFIRYPVIHSHAERELGGVALTNHDEQVAKGFLAWFPGGKCLHIKPKGRSLLRPLFAFIVVFLPYHHFSVLTRPVILGATFLVQSLLNLITEIKIPQYFYGLISVVSDLR